MNPIWHKCRRGMTLVELLVVVAIIGLLAVTVLPTLSDSTESRRAREATRVLTSFIAKAQSRALGRTEWSGFMIKPTSADSFAALDLIPADVPPVYRGDTVPALLRISMASPSTRIATGTSGQLTLSTSVGVGLQRNDLIRFGGRDPWYELQESATTGISLRFGIRGDLPAADVTGSQNSESAGQTTANTPWPAENVEGLPFEVLRQPLAGGTPLLVPESRVIDLYWSGVASGLSYNRFDVTGGTTPTMGAAATILFDGTGRVRQIQLKNAASTMIRRLAVSGPIFLLLGRPDRVITNPADPSDPNQPANRRSDDEATGANWQYPDSYWIAIDPFTGVAKSAECKASAATVEQSQQWIRQALLTGSGE